MNPGLHGERLAINHLGEPWQITLMMFMSLVVISEMFSLSDLSVLHCSEMLKIIIAVVAVKPFFGKEPSDVTVLEGQSVEFQCRVSGDPVPNILWRRDDGKMPIGRAQILDDKSLRIENVEPVDEGLYICDAENLVGSVSARASLTVHCEYPLILIQ
jgi:hypothetical protein